MLNQETPIEVKGKEIACSLEGFTTPASHVRIFCPVCNQENTFFLVFGHTIHNCINKKCGQLLKVSIGQKLIG